MAHYQGSYIDIIRHGEPEGGRMYRGSGTDHPLSGTGWQQMHNAVSRHYLVADDSSPWDLIISSPLARCRDFATVLSKQLAIPQRTRHDLTEVDFGDWEGKTAAEIQALDPDLFRKYQRDPFRHRPPGAEPLATFNQRVINGIQNIFGEYPHKKVLLVSHGGVMRSILTHVLAGLAEKRQCVRFPYAAMMRLSLQHEQMRLEFL